MPKDWHHANYVDHEIWGVSTQQAYEYLEDHNSILRPVVVAVIDGDLDVNHEDLKHKLWKNPKVNNKRYPGAEHGWNFLGVGDNRLISKVGTEAFREYKRLRPKYEGKKREDFRKTEDLKEFDYFQQVKKDAKIQGYLNFFPIIEMTFDAYRKTDSILRLDPVYHENIRLNEVVNLKASDTTLQQYVDAAIRSNWKFADTVRWQDVYTYQTEEYNTAVQRIKSLDNTSNPRDSIGDDQHSLKDRYYGNSVLVDSNSFHGTFVAGLIGAERDNGIGIDGIAQNARLMGIRAVPDGDEFDKDVALAIRFAVDHGAQIVNMSFGKYYSPNARWVTDAIQYALKKNVLVIQAAGNDNRDLDTVVSFPRPPAKIKKKRDSYLMIGASTSTGDKASFSNYGKEEVDFFAPGEKVTSTATFDAYKLASGTSFSAPVVSGIAALVWGSYPKLKAYEVAEILRLSAGKNLQDKLKGYAIVPGIINAHDALQIAKEYVEK
ncbi:S8 family serine peptidase [Sphingobacterium chuzhouense]|uniref:S8 family serine peptidase n=1 Tax=Sphingobacterium chuzhouense TaxID=1742264 RepID=A0ABR7XSD6_9SPHI|nr:S8 family serine peptidase [Sphingobacterium chuzhouense]MBD1421202.1 S8 family serine peptidase [Sphingobacterium chuzhouense]